MAVGVPPVGSRQKRTPRVSTKVGYSFWSMTPLPSRSDVTKSHWQSSSVTPESNVGGFVAVGRGVNARGTGAGVVRVAVIGAGVSTGVGSTATGGADTGEEVMGRVIGAGAAVVAGTGTGVITGGADWTGIGVKGA